MYLGDMLAWNIHKPFHWENLCCTLGTVIWSAIACRVCSAEEHVYVIVNILLRGTMMRMLKIASLRLKYFKEIVILSVERSAWDRVMNGSRRNIRGRVTVSRIRFIWAYPFIVGDFQGNNVIECVTLRIHLWVVLTRMLFCFKMTVVESTLTHYIFSYCTCFNVS